MKLNIPAALLIAVTLLATSLHAREIVPIVNHDNLAVVSGNGKPVQAEQVKQAIQAAAGAKTWTIAAQADGSLLATLVVRNKHTIKVAVTYAADTYSLHYKDSINMKYGTRDDKPAIHPFYNKWVQELQEAIRLELLKL